MQPTSNRLRRRFLAGALALAALPVILPHQADARETEGDRRRRLAAEKRDKVIKDRDMVKWQAEPGRQRIGPMKPAWCDLTSEWKGKITGGILGRQLGKAKRYGLSYSTLVDVAAMLCAHPNQPSWQKQTGYVVQKYVNETGLNKKDVIASIRARLKKARWKRDQKAFCRTVPRAGGSDENKLMHKIYRRLYGCNNYGIFWRTESGGNKELLWYIDRRATPDSEVLRAYYVLDCLKGSETIAQKSPPALADYAVCGLDARKLSRARLEAELAKAPHNSYSRTLARETFGVALAAAGRYKRAVDALVKRDAIYKKVFYDAPQAAWNKWLANYNKNKQHIEAAIAFEARVAGPSISALRGCRAQLGKHLTSYLRSKKIRTRKQLFKVITDNVSAWLVGALVWCNGVEGTRWEGHMFAKILGKARNARGPRAAATYAVIDAIESARKDRTRFGLTPRALRSIPEPYRQNKQRIFWSKRGLSSGFVVEKGKGAVRSVRKTRHGLRITFKRTRVREDVYDCKTTNRVWKIDSSGKVLYHRSCRIIGKKWVDTTPKPVYIPRYAGAGIRRGRYMHFVADMAISNPKYIRKGYPTTVYRSKRKKRVVAAYGFKL